MLILENIEKKKEESKECNHKKSSHTPRIITVKMLTCCLPIIFCVHIFYTVEFKLHIEIQMKYINNILS